MKNMIVVAMTALLFVGLTSGLLPGTAGHAQAAPGKVFQSANML